MTFSILICSITGRELALKRLLAILLRGKWQHISEDFKEHKLDFYYSGEAEIIIYTDNKKITIGEKRNRLRKLATGKYISFIDDDDTVAVEYIDEILSATQKNKDVIVFDAMRFVNGVKDKQVKYNAGFKKDSQNHQFYFRVPNHLMVFKKEIADKVPYQNISFGEDSIFAKQILPLIKSQHQINKVLYHYLFNDKK